ncbi:YTH domain-containing protein 1, partial [Aplysia californica]|uniref:YTH domain-containing protein 1 n=1 Tax=Aplysia californica TaxID=6500 RepID=A0ABM1ACJ4_APLCA
MASSENARPPLQNGDRPREGKEEGSEEVSSTTSSSPMSRDVVKKSPLDSATEMKPLLADEDGDDDDEDDEEKEGREEEEAEEDSASWNGSAVKSRPTRSSVHGGGGVLPPLDSPPSLGHGAEINSFPKLRSNGEILTPGVEARRQDDAQSAVTKHVNHRSTTSPRTASRPSLPQPNVRVEGRGGESESRSRGAEEEEREGEEEARRRSSGRRQARNASGEDMTQKTRTRGGVVASSALHAGDRHASGSSGGGLSADLDLRPVDAGSQTGLEVGLEEVEEEEIEEEKGVGKEEKDVEEVEIEKDIKEKYTEVEEEEKDIKDTEEVKGEEDEREEVEVEE